MQKNRQTVVECSGVANFYTPASLQYFFDGLRLRNITTTLCSEILRDKIHFDEKFETIVILLTVADLENFGGGDFKHITSKIRMSSPKLRVIFRPKSEIQTFFSPKIGWSPKK